MLQVLLEPVPFLFFLLFLGLLYDELVVAFIFLLFRLSD
jgi:hypothetical protein